VKIPSFLALATSLYLAMSPAFGGSSSAEKHLQEPILEASNSRIHALVNLDFSDHYISLHGLNLENQGLIFQPLVMLFVNAYHREEAFLQDVTISAGVWNSIHTERSGPENGRWNQTNPVLGITAKFADRWQFDILGTQYYSQTDFFPTSTNLSLKLTYKDNPAGPFSLNPYIEFWAELDEKATVVFNRDTVEEGWYVALGATPTLRLSSLPFMLEAHTYAYFVSDEFYQRMDGSNGGSGFAMFSTFPRVVMPLAFVPKNCGAWSVYAGVQYYRFENDGLRDGNLILADSSRDQDLFQFRAGLTVFF
jgi:hypothetical protein